MYDSLDNQLCIHIFLQGESSQGDVLNINTRQRSTLKKFCKTILDRQIKGQNLHNQIFKKVLCLVFHKRLKYNTHQSPCIF